MSVQTGHPGTGEAGGHGTQMHRPRWLCVHPAPSPPQPLPHSRHVPWVDSRSAHAEPGGLGRAQGPIPNPGGDSETWLLSASLPRLRVWAIVAQDPGGNDDCAQGDGCARWGAEAIRQTAGAGAGAQRLRRRTHWLQEPPPWGGGGPPRPATAPSCSGATSGHKPHTEVACPFFPEQVPG